MERGKNVSISKSQMGEGQVVILQKVFSPVLLIFVKWHILIVQDNFGKIIEVVRRKMWFFYRVIGQFQNIYFLAMERE